MIKIGINGFGRIGRFVFRSTVEAENAISIIAPRHPGGWRHRAAGGLVTGRVR